MSYTAPIRDLMFAATELADLPGVNRLPGFEDATPELLRTILEEAGKFASDELAPLNRSGDKQGVRLEDGRAITADGWKAAYKKFVDGGWNSLPFDPLFGGQGLPWLAATAVAEIWHAANMSFSLCPLLTQGAVGAIQTHGSDEQKSTYLPKLVSGEWSGTMNLTESQAGSDLGALTTRAVPQDDHYLLNGQKIFITYGDHDLAENIIHMVLARISDAPEGVKGISLFIVPKFLPDEKGNWTKRNDIETIALESKLGIHASPTATLAYGGKGGAVGYLIGGENRGLHCMFTMMNLARQAVGVEGNGVAERAYQQAVAYANERVQGQAVDAPDGGRVPIIHHPDVKRLLLQQKCRIEALRSLSLWIAACMDNSARHIEGKARARAQAMVEVMTPVLKGYATEAGLENVSHALQVHGGMGYIEETGAAQHFRDQRITPIYEGTTGIQAMDLVGRKLIRDGGAMHAQVISRMREDCAAAAKSESKEVAAMAKSLEEAIALLDAVAQEILSSSEDPRLAAAVCEPYLRMWGVVACGWQMARAAGVSAEKLAQKDDAFYRNKIRTAQFYFGAELPKAASLAASIRESGRVIAETAPELFQTE